MEELNTGKTYIVLDLEMCQVPKESRTKEYKHQSEIIQIGAVKLNETYEELSRFSVFVKPAFGFINEFIENLTGISQKQVDNAPDLKEAMEEFLDWVDCDDAVFVSWSMTDKHQIQCECLCKGIGGDRYTEMYQNWLDCQRLFGIEVNAKDNWSLERALFAAEIDTEGHLHDGLMDAVNTASLFRKIKTEPDFKLNDLYESTRTEEVEHLSFSMGSIFEQLNIKL